MTHHSWNLLQLFAGEGGSAAGEGAVSGAESGVSPADAGQQHLLELGVPKDKLRPPRAKKPSTLPEGAIRTQQKEEPQAAAAKEEPKEMPKRMSWEEIKNDPEYSAEIQNIIRSRLKESGESKAILETLAPALKLLAEENGLDPENIDHAALVKALTGEYEDKALEMGVSQQQAMELDKEQRTLEQQKFADHIQKLESQGQALKTTFPNFDLRSELQNPTFARLTSPSVGLSVEDAFYAVHRKELQTASMQVAAQRTAQMFANAVQSGSMRPDEAGSSVQAPASVAFDYRNATPAQREELKRRIREAAARGEKIYPG